MVMNVLKNQDTDGMGTSAFTDLALADCPKFPAKVQGAQDSLT
jgi:hypothetical protein